MNIPSDSNLLEQRLLDYVRSFLAEGERILGVFEINGIMLEVETQNSQNNQLLLTRIYPQQEPDLDQARKSWGAVGELVSTIDSPRLLPSNGLDEGNGAVFHRVPAPGGVSLESLINESGPLPPELATRLTLDLLSAIDALVSRGIGHYQMSASAVWLGTDFRAALKDYGLFDLERRLGGFNSRDIWNDAAYIPPERLGGNPPGVTCDLFATGVLLYQMLTGRLPWQGDPGTVAAAQKKGLPEPKNLRSDMRQGLVMLLRRALAPDPAHRFQDTNEFKQALIYLLPTHERVRLLGMPLVDPDSISPKERARIVKELDRVKNMCDQHRYDEALRVLDGLLMVSVHKKVLALSEKVYRLKQSEKVNAHLHRLEEAMQSRDARKALQEAIAICAWEPENKETYKALKRLLGALRHKRVPRAFQPDREWATARIQKLVSDGQERTALVTRFLLAFAPQPDTEVVALLTGGEDATVQVEPLSEGASSESVSEQASAGAVPEADELDQNAPAPEAEPPNLIQQAKAAAADGDIHRAWEILSQISSDDPLFGEATMLKVEWDDLRASTPPKKPESKEDPHSAPTVELSRPEALASPSQTDSEEDKPKEPQPPAPSPPEPRGDRKASQADSSEGVADLPLDKGSAPSKPNKAVLYGVIALAAVLLLAGVFWLKSRADRQEAAAAAYAQAAQIENAGQWETALDAFRQLEQEYPGFENTPTRISALEQKISNRKQQIAGLWQKTQDFLDQELVFEDGQNDAMGTLTRLLELDPQHALGNGLLEQIRQDQAQQVEGHLEAEDASAAKSAYERLTQMHADFADSQLSQRVDDLVRRKILQPALEKLNTAIVRKRWDTAFDINQNIEEVLPRDTSVREIWDLVWEKWATQLAEAEAVDNKKKQLEILDLMVRLRPENQNLVSRRDSLSREMNQDKITGLEQRIENAMSSSAFVRAGLLANELRRLDSGNRVAEDALYSVINKLQTQAGQEARRNPRGAIQTYGQLLRIMNLKKYRQQRDKVQRRVTAFDNRLAGAHESANADYATYRDVVQKVLDDFPDFVQDATYKKNVQLLADMEAENQQLRDLLAWERKVRDDNSVSYQDIVNRLDSSGRFKFQFARQASAKLLSGYLNRIENYTGGVTIVIRGAENLPASSDFGNKKPDGFCILQVGNQSFKTDTVNNDYNPLWNESCSFVFGEKDTLQFQVFEANRLGRSKELGTIQLEKLPKSGKGQVLKYPEGWSLIIDVRRER